MDKPERHLAVSAICGMICLAVAGSALGAGTSFDGVYTGKRVLTKGSGPGCPAEDDVSVTIHGETATFTDSSFQKFLMGFNPHPDGSFDQISVSVGDASVLIKGRIIGNIIEADVTNETFEHHWHLKKD